MFMATAPPDDRRERMLAAIDTIDADLADVALWASALSALQQPVRNYEPADLRSEYVQRWRS